MLHEGHTSTDGPLWTRVTVAGCTTLTGISVVYAFIIGDAQVILPATFAAIWGAGAALMWRMHPVSVPIGIAAAAFALLVFVGDAVFRFS